MYCAGLLCLLVNPAMQVVLRNPGFACPKKTRNQQRSALLEYMHWDLMPPLKETKKIMYCK